MSALAPATVRDLWEHARALAERAEREADHPALRRALVTCAVAGSGDDPEGFRALLADVWAWLQAGGPEAEGPDWLSPHAATGMAPEREREVLTAVAR